MDPDSQTCSVWNAGSQSSSTDSGISSSFSYSRYDSCGTSDSYTSTSTVGSVYSSSSDYLYWGLTLRRYLINLGGSYYSKDEKEKTETYGRTESQRASVWHTWPDYPKETSLETSTKTDRKASRTQVSSSTYQLLSPQPGTYYYPPAATTFYAADGTYGGYHGWCGMDGTPYGGGGLGSSSLIPHYVDGPGYWVSGQSKTASSAYTYTSDDCYLNYSQTWSTYNMWHDPAYQRPGSRRRNNDWWGEYDRYTTIPLRSSSFGDMAEARKFEYPLARYSSDGYETRYRAGSYRSICGGGWYTIFDHTLGISISKPRTPYTSDQADGKLTIDDRRLIMIGTYRWGSGVEAPGASERPVIIGGVYYP